ncbi:hypothetical protein [Prochlorococcus sp. MIT 0801]|uniref:hypothetical protein n=1 Tax=Prochlorococcus sp. MIT 0801 TaxID=1501269 RepID=UPI0004F8F229|nr:hypothetical protein [Prochlorococcus sp. MIT 0801]AIQ97821.1 hypothetical protein EW15_1729 [Prochlorococcus sp. MIT 0801]
MKIYIHAGTHKTATTSFQKLCFIKKEDLCEQGLFIPEFKDKSKIINFAQSRGMKVYDLSIQHNFLAWYLQLKEIDEIKEFLINAYVNAKRKKCNSILISAEDFENILVDEYMANYFESISKEVGFSEIEWIFVKRNSFNYLKSLYSELSKYGLILEFYQLYKIIMTNGYYRVSNHWYSNIYIFDLINLIERFKRKHSSNISIIKFEDFISPYLGFTILNKIIPVNKLNKLDIGEEKIINANKSLTIHEIEFNYLCNFLRLSPESKTYENNKELFNKLISYRQRKNNEATELIKESINRKFG